MQTHYPLNPATGLEDVTMLPWTNGSPAGGIEGSYPGFGLFTDAQTEILAAIVEAGITPSGSDLAQLLRAVRGGKLTYYADTGAANAMVITPTTVHTAYSAGLAFNVMAGHANTGAVTLNVNGLGAKAVTRMDGSACVAGDFAANAILRLIYDGTQFQIQNLSGNNFQPRASTVLTTGSGNFTVPAGVTMLKVRAWSGGGGGGGIQSVGAAAGGNGGAYSEGYLAVTPGQVIAYVVGAGGAGGGTALNGSVGGTSSFGAISCTGGGGGGASSGGVAGATGAGSTATGGSVLNLQGFSGAPGSILGTTFAAGGAGGAACLSGPCFQPICLSTTVAGNGGAIPGGGGGGAAGLSGNASGGAGGRGQIIIEY